MPPARSSLSLGSSAPKGPGGAGDPNHSSTSQGTGGWHSHSRGQGGKFVKKVLNTDFPWYQKENLCIAFEFNFSIKAFSL